MVGAADFGLLAVLGTWKKACSTNERRYAALVKCMQMLHQFRVDHVQGMSQTMADFNAVMAKLQREMGGKVSLGEKESGELQKQKSLSDPWRKQCCFQKRWAGKSLQ